MRNTIRQIAWWILLTARWHRFPRRHPRRVRANTPNALEAHIAQNSYGAFCVPLSSVFSPASQAILAGEQWEPKTVEYLCSNARGSVITAGAYFGDFIPALASSYEHVYAFEPCEESYRCADITIRLNALSNVSLAHLAVSNRSGHADLTTYGTNGVRLGGSSSLKRHGDTRETVSLAKIDDLIPGNAQIGAIHLDIEGAELEAVQGAASVIKRCRPLLILERPEKNKALLELLSELGYRQGLRLHHNKAFYPEKR